MRSDAPDSDPTRIGRFLSGSVVVRLAVTSSFLIVISCVLLSAVLVRRHLAEMAHNLSDRGEVISAFLAREGELGVLSGDREALRKLADVALAQRDVRYCRFLDRDGSVLAEAGESIGAGPGARPGGMGSHPQAEVLEFEAPVSSRTAARQREEVGLAFDPELAAAAPREEVGSVAVGIAVAPLHAERRRAFGTAVGFTAGIALMAVVSALLLTLGQLKALASNADLAAERARVAELKTRLVAQASHEFRTPLAVIMAAADVLHRYGSRLSQAQQQERLNKIRGNVRHMTDLLDDVLSVGRADAAKLARQPVDLAALCREVLADVRSEGRDRCEVVCTATGLMKPVPLDPKLVRQIVRNLITNALKYSPQGGRVQVEASRGAGEVCVRVSDQGIGISPQDQARLFEPFHRGENVGRIPGTGLGLAITQRAVAEHGGNIMVQSVVGEGTTFTVTLPVGENNGAGVGPAGEEPGRNAGGKTARLAGMLLALALAAAAPNAGARVGLDKHDAVPAPEMILFEEPNITGATKAEQSAGEAPASVTVITRDDIQRHGYRTLAEALRTVRGFYSTNDRNYSYVGVRGFLRPGDYNDRILVLVNGHTYNDDVYQSALLGQEFGVDLEAIERIEVISGPGSALYGGNALFAVVNVVTVGAAQEPGVRPLAETGSFGRKRGQMSAGHTFASGVEVYASGSVLDVDGPGKLFYPEYDSPETGGGVARNADAERAYNAFVSARYGGLFFQGGYNHRAKENPTGAFGALFGDDDTETIDSRSFAELALTRDVQPGLTLSARAYYDGYYYSGSFIYPDEEGGRFRNLDHAWSYWGGTELRARWQAFAGNALTAGAEFSYHPDVFQDNYDDLDPRVTYLDVHRSFGTWGVYLQDEWTLRPNLELVTGIRFDRYDDRLNEANPRIALIWRPRERTSAKLLFGRAFRPPNLYEQYYETPASEPVAHANPHLDAETILTYEAVLEHRFAGGAQGTVAFYHYTLDGLIETAILDDGAATQFRNLDNVDAWGAELELRVPLRHRVWLRADYSYQDTRADGRLLSNSPHHLGHAGVLFPLPFGAEGGLDLQVVGPRLTLQRRHVETVHLLNLTVNLPPIRGFRLSGSIYNLFDQEYDDPAGSEHLQDRIEQDGLTFRVGLQYAF